MDAEVCWDRVEEANGWKLQRNKITTNHHRIIAPDTKGNSIRVANGSKYEMTLSFKRIKQQLKH